MQEMQRQYFESLAEDKEERVKLQFKNNFGGKRRRREKVLLQTHTGATKNRLGSGAAHSQHGLGQEKEEKERQR